MNDSAKDSWYADGLSFTCTQCGECCGGEPGYVWVSREDIARMARLLGMGTSVFRRRYVRRVWQRLSLKERENGDCVMLDGRGCRVYAERPYQCRSFPFWADALASRNAWDALKTRCPGVGRGRCWTLEEISAILAGRADATTTANE